MPRAQQFSFDESQSKKTPSGMENQGTEGRSNSAIVSHPCVVLCGTAPGFWTGMEWLEGGRSVGFRTTLC